MDDPAEDYLTTLESAVVADGQPTPLVGDRRWLRRLAWAAALIGIPAFVTAWFRPADVRLFSNPLDAAVVGIVGFAGLVIVSRWSKRSRWKVELGTFAGVAGVVLIALGIPLLLFNGSSYRHTQVRAKVAGSDTTIAGLQVSSNSTEIVIQSPLGPLTREVVVLAGKGCDSTTVEQEDERTFLLSAGGGSGCMGDGSRRITVGDDGWTYEIEEFEPPDQELDEPCVEPSTSSMTCMD